MYGFTDNYVKVKTKWDAELIITISQVKLVAVDAEGTVQCAELDYSR
jgi:threonylcarbamoyladenosine tRNA methylthiotransferase MtaB